MEHLLITDINDNIEILLKEKNQTNILDYLKSETNESLEKNNFMKKLSEIDYTLLDKLFNLYKDRTNQGKIEVQNEAKNITPLQNQFSKSDFTETEKNSILNIGFEKIFSGKVALLILAGGQGSRLGFNKAKGMYNINMPSNKSLFEYISNRFLSVQNLSYKICQNKKEIDLSQKNNSNFLIMTSKDNHNETISFYKKNNYFGINPENIRFFPQDTLPAIDLNGNIIIKNKFEIFEAPNGNGGCFIAMKNEKILEFLKEKKVEYINVVSIDNPLVKPLDPFYIGLTYLKNKKMSAKTIPKINPKEAIGVFVKINDKPMMIDYADLNEDLSNLRETNSDKLVYRASNILNYLISVETLDKVLNNPKNFQELINDFHIAKKNIVCYDYKNNLYEKKFSTVPGLKFELFFNTIFIFSDDLLLFEVNRLEEFSPVKNGEEALTDNPRTTRQMMSDLFKVWLSKAGVEYKDNQQRNEILEISFLRSYEGENLDNEEIREKTIDMNNGPYCLN